MRRLIFTLIATVVLGTQAFAEGDCTLAKVGNLKNLLQHDAPGHTWIPVMLPKSAVNFAGLPQGKSSARFAVVVRAPHSAARYDLNARIQRIDLCTVREISPDGVVSTVQTMRYNLLITRRSMEQGDYLVGTLLLPSEVAATKPAVRTWVNNTPMGGTWSEDDRGTPIVKLSAIDLPS